MTSGMERVPELVLGTAQLERAYGVTARRGPNTTSRALALLDCAWELGIRTLDTAPTYGRAEEIIGRSSHPFTIHTKIEPSISARDSLVRSLERLNRSLVDVLYIHDSTCLESDIEGAIGQLEQTLGVGTGSIGVSIYEQSELELIRSLGMEIVVQVPGSVVDRRFLSGHGTGLRTFVRSVFLQGTLLCGQGDLGAGVEHLRPYVREFHRACSTIGIDPLTGCLAWVRRQCGVNGVLVGAQNETELTSIAAAWRAAADETIDVHELTRLPQPSSVDVDPRRWS